MLRAWRERGYRVALWCDGAADFTEHKEHGVDIRHQNRNYPGYAVATNKLIAYVLGFDSSCDWCVIGGDDVWPDQNHSAEEIARECRAYFFKQRQGQIGVVALQEDCTFGVMQPVGDRWGENDAWAQSLPTNRRAYIDRVCGSAWLGREFCERVNGGRGPLWPEYFHMYVDEELQAVAEKLGVLWQRPDLTQRHEHWIRGGDMNAKPEFHQDPRKQMDHGARVFNRRKAEGFPGYGPLVEVAR